VFWDEANRAALIELKWLGQSLKEDLNIPSLLLNDIIFDNDVFIAVGDSGTVIKSTN